MMDRMRAWWAAKQSQWRADEERRASVEEYLQQLSEGRDPDA